MEPKKPSPKSSEIVINELLPIDSELNVLFQLFSLRWGENNSVEMKEMRE